MQTVKGLHDTCEGFACYLAFRWGMRCYRPLHGSTSYVGGTSEALTSATFKWELRGGNTGKGPMKELYSLTTNLAPHVSYQQLLGAVSCDALLGGFRLPLTDACDIHFKLGEGYFEVVVTPPGLDSYCRV